MNTRGPAGKQEEKDGWLFYFCSLMYVRICVIALVYCEELSSENDSENFSNQPCEEETGLKWVRSLHLYKHSLSL